MRGDVYAYASSSSAAAGRAAGRAVGRALGYSMGEDANEICGMASPVHEELGGGHRYHSSSASTAGSSAEEPMGMACEAAGGSAGLAVAEAVDTEAAPVWGLDELAAEAGLELSEQSMVVGGAEMMEPMPAAAAV